MFVGHVAVGFAAKPAAPRTPLGTLVLAAVLLDVLAWSFVVAGIEHFAIKPGITATNPFDLHDYPFSHSLLMALVWGAVMAGAYYAIRRYERGALLIFAAVVSHWVLDFVSHRPDMPLAPGIHRYYGLGLYNSRPGMLLVKGLLWLGSIVLYERATRSRKRAGFWTMYIGVLLLTLLWLGSLNGRAANLSIVQMGIIDLIFLAILVSWCYLMDELRVVQSQAPEPPLASQAHQEG
jgi:membrane-bound metal-dependent hydrolase YbcI (DUF457 family)